MPIVRGNLKKVAKRVAKATGLTEVRATEVLNAAFDAMGDLLAETGDLSILAIGRFQVKDRPARTMKGPRGVGQIQVPHKKVVKFKASARFRNRATRAEAGASTG